MVFIALRPWPCLVISATIYLCDRHCHWLRTHLFRSTDRTWCKWSCLRPVRGATVAKSRDKFLWHVRAEPSCSLCLDAPPPCDSVSIIRDYLDVILDPRFSFESLPSPTVLWKCSQVNFVAKSQLYLPEMQSGRFIGLLAEVMFHSTLFDNRGMSTMQGCFEGIEVLETWNYYGLRSPWQR